MEPDLSKDELRAVARRPAGVRSRTSCESLRDLASFRALKATVEFQRDDALGIAAQLAYYLILAIFPFILVLVSLMGTFRERGTGLGGPRLLRTGHAGAAYEIIETFTSSIISGDAEAPGLFTFGILFTIWAASAPSPPS